jgi:D-alanyl-lipoteichoic acid acyltransferase DltB (MBOAT superfamily)
MFFPKMLQGPIERPAKIFTQFREEKSFDYDRIVDGLKIILWGYFKKLVVSDRLAIYVDAVYGNASQHNGTSLAVATFFYAFQIYADFSGYTDIAIGSAKVLGFNLTYNFNRPYFATSIKEFWNRWHISFSTWLRDYLFLPLAYFFSRKMKKEKYLGIATEKWIFTFLALITFAVCGIWHGEGLNYLAWGILFGIYLSFSNWTSKLNKKIRNKLGIFKPSGFYKSYKILFTFLLVLFTFVFFRAESLSAGFEIIGKVFSTSGSIFIGSPSFFIYSIFGILFMLVHEFKTEFYPGSFEFFNNKNQWIRKLSYSFIIVLILLIGVLDGGQFIYFKF